MTEAPPIVHRSRWPGVVAWAMTLAAVLALAWFAVSLLNRCTPAGLAEGAGRGLAAVAERMSDILKPTITVSPLVVLRGEDKEPKLVVYSHTSDITVPLEESAWYGTTYSSALARNCRAQFVVPIDRMTDRDVVLVPGRDGEPARILIIAPRPRLDTDMLVIAPDTIEFTERNSGLNRVTRMFAGPDRERLTKYLRPAMLEAMGSPDVRARAEQSAREFFEKRFAEMLRSELKMGRDVVVDVRWVDH
jgi:predicted pyridoxine 5'-phosphate oxidase superfamily flavin-nucleotide-binding protein